MRDTYACKNTYMLNLYSWQLIFFYQLINKSTNCSISTCTPDFSESPVTKTVPRTVHKHNFSYRLQIVVAPQSNVVNSN